jgi:RNA polymerase sigma-70 factor (ECF subfamily)
MSDAAAIASGDDAEAAARVLLGGIAGGDERALETFYRDYHGAVYQFALRLVGNPADASELVNESMLEVWKAAAGFRGGSRVRTWLLSIVNHRAIDLLRRKRRHDSVELDEEIVDDTACDMPDVLAGTQRAQQVRTCIERLPDRQRQIVHLTFFEQMAYPEIAQVLDVPSGTVKTRMMHAKTKLMHCLAGFLKRGEHA